MYGKELLSADEPVMYGKELLSADELARYDNVKLIVSLQGITTLLAYESPGSIRHSTLLANRRLVSDTILARMDAARPLPDGVEVLDEVQE